MSDQSTSDFTLLRQKPIFTEIMRQGPRDAERLETLLVAILESVLEDCQQDGLTPDEIYWLLELHARTVIGAQIAWYLDRMINPDEREEIKQKLLSAAEAISSLRKGRATEPEHGSRSCPLRDHDHADGVSGSVYERVEQTLADKAQ